MKTIKLKIHSQSDRENMLIALANNGYKVWVEEIEDNVCNITYLVCFVLSALKDKE